jgi:hypothetical protein
MERILQVGIRSSGNLRILNFAENENYSVYSTWTSIYSTALSCALYCLCSFVCCVLFERGVLCVFFMLRLIAVPLPPGKYPFAVNLSNSNYLLFGLESREYCRRDPARWPRSTLFPQKLELTSQTSGGLSVCIVRSWTQATEFFSFFLLSLEKQPALNHSLPQKILSDFIRFSLLWISQ